MSPSEPRVVYIRLLEQRRAACLDSERSHRRLGYGQLGLLACGAGIAWAALAREAVSILWLFLPAAAFVLLAVVHDRALRDLEKRRRAVRYYERGLARLEGRWAGSGEAGGGYLEAAHPYARDLDLFGKGSLFELLCTARTHIGEDTLARWLLAPAAPETLRARHAAVRELVPRLELREELAVLAEGARTGVDPLALAAWGEAPGGLGGTRMRGAAKALTVLGLAGLCGLAGLVAQHAVPMEEATVAVMRNLFLMAVAVNGVFLYRVHRRQAAVVAAVEEASHQLDLLAEVLVRLERESFQSAALAELGGRLKAHGGPPSRRLARLHRLVEMLDSRDHVLVRLLEPFVLWTTHLGLAVEDWRRESGGAVRGWLTAAGEMEALCSLASHAWEHPEDRFPEFVEEGPWLEAEGIGHPLIPEGRLVRNDVQLGGQLRLLVVSGSNMAGKSTLLRALGVNAVLAQAGAPVRARALRMSPLAVGASIRIADSLQDGISRFYAEILRLRQILDLTGGRAPVLFLIDEFLHGTNSGDRLRGATALARRLVERGAAGLITTHDLALAGIVEALDGRGANVHFEDHIEDGRIRFDYRMRPGVVRKSNALELMRSVGLEI